MNLPPDHTLLQTPGFRARIEAAGPVLALLAAVTIAWCIAYSRWDGASWQQIPGYDSPVTSDALTSLAAMKAVSDGHLRPMMWKTIPELGAPAGAGWNDYPIIEELPIYFQGLLGKALGLFAGLNLSLLIGHLLAAGTFYGVARFSGCDRRWSFAGAFAYGLAPFVFAQSPHHITVAWAWHVPLFLPVWKWLSSDAGLPPGSRRFWFAAAVAFVAGAQNVYYTNIFCQLALLGGLVAFLRNRSLSSLLSCVAIIGAAALAFGLMNLDSWTYKLVHGPNTGAVVREYKWLEIYGLKLVDLVIPPVVHRSDLLAAFAASHRAGAPLQDEGSYLGLLGILSLALLLATAAAAVIRRRYSEIPAETWQVLWIFIAFTTGGVNAIVGALGFTMFRTGCRYSIVLLAISLLFAARWITARKLRPPFASALAALACVIVLWDQIPRSPAREEMERTAFLIDSDRELVEKMESALPPGAMVFQIPIMQFPESPAPGLSPYDQLRPYLFSHTLRFSFGSMKGRDDTRWQADLVGVPFEDAVRKLKDLGFQALLISRNGLPDKGSGLVKTLAGMGYRNLIESAAGDLVCVLLPPTTNPAPLPRQ
jgi:phosphoglycerol transferase